MLPCFGEQYQNFVLELVFPSRILFIFYFWLCSLCISNLPLTSRLRDNIEELRRSLQPKENALEALQQSLLEKEQVTMVNSILKRLGLLSCCKYYNFWSWVDTLIFCYDVHYIFFFFCVYVYKWTYQFSSLFVPSQMYSLFLIPLEERKN